MSADTLPAMAALGVVLGMLLRKLAVRQMEHPSPKRRTAGIGSGFVFVNGTIQDGDVLPAPVRDVRFESDGVVVKVDLTGLVSASRPVEVVLGYASNARLLPSASRPGCRFSVTSA